MGKVSLAEVGHCKHGRYESEVWVTLFILLAEMREILVIMWLLLTRESEMTKWTELIFHSATTY